MNSEDNQKEVVLVLDSSGYIWGEVRNLSGNKVIAIYIKNPIVIRSTHAFNAWNYIVMKTRLTIRDDGAIEFPGFQGIRFTKGSLMSVNPCWALHEDWEKEQELNKAIRQKQDETDPYWYIVHRAYSDEKEFCVDIDGHSIKWRFQTDISGYMSVDRGSSLENTRSRLDVYFDENHDLQFFYDYYGYVTALMSFLTFRRDVHYESIKLLYQNQYGYADFAECYVNSETDYYAEEGQKQYGKEDKHIRSSMNSLVVRRLTDDAFTKIIHSIMRVEKKGVDLPITVIPKDGRDAGIMTPDKIRSICSALELEMDAAGIKLNKGDELERLIDEVKNVIKDHRDSKENGLPNKTYQHMFKSISYWGDSLADRAIVAWDNNEHLLLPWLKMHAVTVNDEDIAEVVRIRHAITHRGFRDVDEKVGTTAFALLALIMVLALKRVSVEDEVIKDLLKRQFVG